MSHTHTNYMDKVPIKISEKYNLPPITDLPQSDLQRLNSIDENIIDLINYDFSLERNVLSKIDEWKKVRDIEHENRRERIRKYEINRLKEIEEEQKQLLTAVSYPSTDDLSSSSDDDDDIQKQETKVDNLGASKGNSNEENCEINKNNVQYTGTVVQQFSPSHQNFNTILMPTIVPDALNRTDYSKTNSKINVSKINYSDFENDTSSPFDNIELKTINDLDILAQVLNITQKHSDNKDSTLKTNENLNEIVSSATVNTISTTVTTTCSPVIENNIQNLTVSVGDQKNYNENLKYNNMYRENNSNQNNSINSGNIENIQQVTSTFLNANNFYSNSSSVYHNVATTTIPSINASGVSSAMPEIHSYTTNLNEISTSTASRTNNFYIYNNLPNNQNNYDNYIYNNYLMNCEQNFLNYKNFQNDVEQNLPNSIDFSNNAVKNLNLDYKPSCTIRPNENYNSINNYSNNSVSGCYGNKSKSVPDILKELNDEIRDSKIRRSTERYKDFENYENSCDEKFQLKSNKNTGITETFMKLSPSSQILAKNISSMGFPLERVSKVAEKFGNDDKKIFEHLIPLSELLDLGFEESKISEALIKFNNNKEKALDFLIS